MATRLSTRQNLTRSDTPDSLLSTLTADASSSNAQSSSSTPPTSAADSASISSTSLKLDAAADLAADLAAQSTATRPRRARSSTGIVVARNAPTPLALSAKAAEPRGRKKIEVEPRDEREIEVSTRRRTISGDTLVDSLSGNGSSETISKVATRLVSDAIEELDLAWKMKELPKSRSMISVAEPKTSPKKHKAKAKADFDRRRSLRSVGEPVETLTEKLSVLSKRGRNAFEASIAKGKRELKRLADTNEFAKIETQPVLHEVWSCGKLVMGDAPPPKKRVKAEPEAEKVAEEEPVPEEKKFKTKRDKIWLSKGLYAGQEGKIDLYAPRVGKGRKSLLLVDPSAKPRTMLPLPIWAGQRLLETGRDFKLPFDVCSPLPPGQPKPDEWRKFSKNRFVGDAAAAWKKSTLFDDFASRCVCSKATGCDESCQNRIMLYECDDGNCSVGHEKCGNRAFTDLQERRTKGGKFRIGVEVIKTADRGYGVRTNRCYDAHQIIVEYTGEIITEDECDRRMREDYKDNECYYLMSFDQNMIIDATRGSIARFVNHSCEPNCRMVKWIVAGKPRMALFAGDKPIMTGEELTYDYNFDPFSAKNVQECRCGSKNCRGVLGPRPKDWQKTNRAQTNKALQSAKEVVKAGKEAGKKALKGAVGAVTAGKRKLKELLGGEDDDEASEPKKRKLAKANSQKAGPRTIQAVKRSPHTSKVVARAKKGVKSVGNKIRLEVTKMSKKTVDGRNQESLTVKKLKTPKKTRLLKTYAAVKAGSRLKGLRQTKLVMGSSTSSLTFAEGDGSEATATPKTSPNTKTPKSTATPKSIGKEEAKAVRGSGKKVTARVVATVSPRAGKRNVVLSVKGRAMKELGEALAARDAAKSASPKGKSPKTLGRKKTIRVISP